MVRKDFGVLIFAVVVLHKDEVKDFMHVVVYYVKEPKKHVEEILKAVQDGFEVGGFKVEDRYGTSPRIDRFNAGKAQNILLVSNTE